MHPILNLYVVRFAKMSDRLYLLAEDFENAGHKAHGWAQENLKTEDGFVVKSIALVANGYRDHLEF